MAGQILPFISAPSKMILVAELVAEMAGDSSGYRPEPPLKVSFHFEHGPSLACEKGMVTEAPWLTRFTITQ